MATTLPNHIRLLAAVLPGRAARLSEPPLRSIQAMAQDVADWINVIPQDMPLRVIGVCSGAPIAALAALQASAAGRPADVHLINPTSDLLPQSVPIHRMEQEQFVSRMLARNILPAELISDREALALFEPMLRADIEAIEEFRETGVERHEPGIDFTLYASPDAQGVADPAPNWLMNIAKNINVVPLRAAADVVSKDPVKGFFRELNFLKVVSLRFGVG